MCYILLAEHEIFGEALSDSDNDDEEAHINVMELDESSRLSVDSRISDSNSMQVRYLEQSTNEPSVSNEPLVTEFSKEMFEIEETVEDVKPDIEDIKIPKIENYEEYEMSENFSEIPNVIFNKGFENIFVYIKNFSTYTYLLIFFFYRFSTSSS